MDIRGQEVLELRRRDGNNDDNNTTTTTTTNINNNNTNNNNNNNNDNNNNFNSNASVSCTTQTLDHHTSYVPLRTLAKSPPSAAAGSTARTVVRYRECLKNHAASVGGSVHDGCGEFMPSGEEGTIEALKCAACDCHRNFHRKEVQGGGGGGGDPISHRHHHQYYGRRPPPPAGVMNMMLNPLQLPPPAGFPPHHHHQKYGRLSPPPTGMVTPMSVAYGGGGSGVGGAESSSEELNLYGQSSGDCHGGVVQPPPSGLPQPPFSLSKKRYRTKFTSEQKERMTEFAEKLGWRMNKQDEEELERFCAEIGVKRQVFKVWMHNNKNNVKKQPV